MKRIAMSVALALMLLAVLAGPVSGTGPPVVFTQTFVFPSFNPCTGAPHTITFTETVSIHSFELDDPERHHFNILFIGTAETDDGFSGREANPIVDNGSGLFGEEAGGTFNFAWNFKLQDDNSRKILFHLNFHLTKLVTTGEFVSVVDNLVLECVGQPT